MLHCTLISGLPSLISYVPGTGPQALFGDASLSICPKTSCEAASIEVHDFENGKTLKKVFEFQNISRLFTVNLC